MMNTVQEMSSFEFQMVCVVRLLLASVCGFAIGIERTNRLKDAGMRTHLIVCMASALMMIVSKYGFFDIAGYAEFFKVDASRVAANIVSGVSFLGAGIIFVRNRSITGLTTSAGIWATSGIGMAMGAGQYVIAIAGTAIIIIAQSLLHNDHITGGGLVENIPRILQEHLTAVLKKEAWTMPPLFSWLQKHGNVASEEMHRVFNCGIGMAVIVSRKQAEQAMAHLRAAGETVYRIGEIRQRTGDEPQTIVE